MGCEEPSRCDGPNGQSKGKGFKTTRCFAGALKTPDALKYYASAYKKASRALEQMMKQVLDRDGGFEDMKSRNE